MVINIRFISRRATRDPNVLTAQTIAAAPVRKPKVIFLRGLKFNPRRRRPGYNWVGVMSGDRVRVFD